MIENLPREERVEIGADFNGHVGDEVVTGQFGVGDGNLDGQAAVGFAERIEGLW